MVIEYEQLNDREILYVKRGRKYVPVENYQRWSGFPANGIWIVDDGRQSLIAKLDELPNPIPLVALERHRERMMKTAADLFDKTIRESFVIFSNGTHRWKTPSFNQLVTAMFQAVADFETKQHANS